MRYKEMGDQKPPEGNQQGTTQQDGEDQTDDEEQVETEVTTSEEASGAGTGGGEGSQHGKSTLHLKSLVSDDSDLAFEDLLGGGHEAVQHAPAAANALTGTSLVDEIAQTLAQNQSFNG